MTKELVDLYLRLSVDREGKDSLERQEADLRAWAKREKLTVRTVWKDAGKSGFKADVHRQNFESAVHAVSTGEVGTLAVWKLDRLSRRGAGQVGLLLDQVEAAGSRIVFLKDNLDSRESSNRMLIIMVSEQARAESANTKLRVREKIAADAVRGRPKGGTRPFGWEPGGIVLRPSEADLVRVAVADYLGGRRSLLRIAKDWNAAGVQTDGMKRERVGRDGMKRPARGIWTATTVRQLVLRERNAGLLVHDGAVMPKSEIEPIITLEEHEALKGRVKAGTPLSERAVTLLGGIIRCECGAPMHGTMSYSQRAKERGNVPAGKRYTYTHYKCSQALYDKSRPHASIVQKTVDDLIIGMLWADLFTGSLDAPGDDLTAALNDVSARLKDNAERTAHVGRILLNPKVASIHRQANGDLAALDIERAELESERNGLLARAAEGGALAAFLEEWRRSDEGFTGTEDREAWEARFWAAWEGVPIERKHAMIRARYRPVVKVGGRGIERVSFTP
jgi:DNA invertase Pin-like site-specific DNA recombinase